MSSNNLVVVVLSTPLKAQARRACSKADYRFATRTLRRHGVAVLNLLHNKPLKLLLNRLVGSGFVH